MSDRFVISQNIGRFRRLLAIGCDDLARNVLTELLAAEEHKLAKLKPLQGDDEPTTPLSPDGRRSSATRCGS